MQAGPDLPLEDRAALNPFFRYFIHLGLPLSVSILIHLGLLAFLALKTFHVVRGGSLELTQWEGRVVETQELRDAFQWAEQNLLEAPADIPLPDDSLSSLTPPPAFSGLDLSALEGLERGQGGGAGVADGMGLGLGEGALSLLGTGSGAGEPGTGGFGAATGGAGSGIGQAGVWNLNVRANRLVYVVDFSGSICTVEQELKRELKRSIGRLVPAQSFNVIIFYGEFEGVRTESFKPKLEPADEPTRREFFAWIDRKKPAGATEPLPAMKRALSLRPDAIFFLSDGNFDDEVVAEIERANRLARVRIYCLLFDEDVLADSGGMPARETEWSRRLRRIAQASGGTLKIVTGKDLAK